MYDMLQRAFEAAGLMWRELHTEDRGDGTLIVVPPDTPASAVAARALGHLAAALRWHNQSASDALRMQLRVALHAGPVIRDAQGLTGHAINQTARLVQARILRKLLTETRADLGVIVSAVGRRQVRDQDVEVNPGRVRGQRRGRRLEGEPLTVRRRLERHPSRVPLHRRAAEQGGPEAREHPGIGAVEHHLPDPADGRLVHPASAGGGRRGG